MPLSWMSIRQGDRSGLARFCIFRPSGDPSTRDECSLIKAPLFLGSWPGADRDDVSIAYPYPAYGIARAVPHHDRDSAHGRRFRP
jgi:hypothetical protein